MHWKEDLRAAAVQGVSGLMLDASIVPGALSLVRFAHPRNSIGVANQPILKSIMLCTCASFE